MFSEQSGVRSTLIYWEYYGTAADLALSVGKKSVTAVNESEVTPEQTIVRAKEVGAAVRVFWGCTWSIVAVIVTLQFPTFVMSIVSISMTSYLRLINRATVTVPLNSN